LCGGLLADLPVDGFPEEVRVAVVAGVLLDHVREDPPQARNCAHVQFSSRLTPVTQLCVRSHPCLTDSVGLVTLELRS
jgi:hypothetical protein